MLFFIYIYFLLLFGLIWWELGEENGVRVLHESRLSLADFSMNR